MHIGLLIKDFAVGEKFSKDGLPTKSGAEFHGENHARQLIARGHRVTIFAKKRHFYTACRENLDGIDLVRLHEPFRGGELALRLLTTHRDIDALYIIGTPSFSVWGIMLAKRFGLPVTLALTGKAEIFDGRKDWRHRLLASCDHYIATTHEIRAGLEQRGGIHAERITVLPHGIDAARYPVPLHEARTVLRAAHGLAADTPVLLFCARIVLNKGIDTLLKLWPVVHASLPEAHLFVVGGGKHELIEALEAMGEKESGSVTVTGEVDRPQEYYQLADVYVFPSRHEGLPTSLLEAMASGLPAVTSDIGGCDDLIVDDVTGYRVDPEDPAAFTSRILSLLRHPQRARELGTAGAAFVRRYCDYGTVIDHLEEIIHDAKTIKAADWLSHRPEAGIEE